MKKGKHSHFTPIMSNLNRIRTHLFLAFILAYANMNAYETTNTSF